jgi:Winged helix DNA-binding domain
VTALARRHLAAFGYRHRDLLIEPSAAPLVYAGGGWIHPSVVRDGRVVGSWRLRRTGITATADVMLFDRAAPLPESLHEVAARLESFLELPVAMRAADL